MCPDNNFINLLVRRTGNQLKGITMSDLMTKERVKTSRRIKALKKRETKIRKQNAITLDRLIKMEAATHDQQIPCDVLEFADKLRWSNSKQSWERIGDLTLPHLIRAVLKDLPPHSKPNWVDYSELDITQNFEVSA